MATILKLLAQKASVFVACFTVKGKILHCYPLGTPEQNRPGDKTRTCSYIVQGKHPTPTQEKPHVLLVGNLYAS